jgi:protocatechuate 3,4-dioxygenase beta subunit
MAAENRHLLSRREALGTFGALGAALVLPPRSGKATRDDAAPDCIVAPEMTEGPFFVDEKLERSDLTSGTAEPFVTNALPLLLHIRVFQAKGRACSPLPGAQVDIWHASAEGVYSGERSGGIQGKDTSREKYLRGYQRTDEKGAVFFKTIYPGWYPGRTVHIHFKIRTLSKSGRPTSDFTSQLFFDDALNDLILSKPPYNTRGERTKRNSNDGIYRRGGSTLLLNAKESADGKSCAAGFAIGLQI